MTEEEDTQLKQELIDLKQAFGHLKEAVAQKDRRIEELEGLLMRALLRNDELERRVAKESHNSHKPPSSDGLKHHLKPKKSKSKGGQPGHPGYALRQVETPDEIIAHRPEQCEACSREWGKVAGQIKERRHIPELPERRLRVIEHRVEAMCCPACQHGTAAPFPLGVDAPAHYGPQMQALVVYLSQFQLLPLERIQELWVDLLGCSLSEGTLANWIAEAARTLRPSMLMIKRLLGWSHVNHVDETGARIKGLLHWFHVSATSFLTFYAWHRKRGQEAMDEIGLLPDDTGRAIHDRLSSDDHYPCAQSSCGAHLLRDCLGGAEHGKHPWAQAMDERLTLMCQVAERWRATGATAVPQAERDDLVLHSFEILQQGFAAHRMVAPPQTPPAPNKPGRRKQDDAQNLLDALLKRAEQVLAFLDDLSVPFTTNQAERDLRMMKVQQKISGTFRSDQGATAFCVIRSYLSTMRKQGRSMLASLTAVFEGSPFSIAWEPGT